MNFGSKGGATIRATFRKDDGTFETILVGNSYKKWTQQLTEFMYRSFGNRDHGWRYADIKGRIVKIERSVSPWIGWGGLKWCSQDLMQGELNREGVQKNESDNPQPRQYSDFHFEEWPYGMRSIIKELREY